MGGDGCQGKKSWGKSFWAKADWAGARGQETQRATEPCPLSVTRISVQLKSGVNRHVLYPGNQGCFIQTLDSGSLTCKLFSTISLGNTGVKTISYSHPHKPGSYGTLSFLFTVQSSDRSSEFQESSRTTFSGPTVGIPLFSKMQFFLGCRLDRP